CLEWLDAPIFSDQGGFRVYAVSWLAVTTPGSAIHPRPVNGYSQVITRAAVPPPDTAATRRPASLSSGRATRTPGPPSACPEKECAFRILPRRATEFAVACPGRPTPGLSGGEKLARFHDLAARPGTLMEGLARNADLAGKTHESQEANEAVGHVEFPPAETVP